MLFGGQTLLSLIDPPAGGDTVYHFSGITSAADMTLAFNFLDPAGLLYLDTVSVSPIPESATMSLLGAGWGDSSSGGAARRPEEIGPTPSAVSAAVRSPTPGES